MLDVTSLGLLVILAGFVVVFIAVLGSSESRGDKVGGAGVIMIGPIPLIFGSDLKWASVAIALAIVLIVVAFVLYGV